MAEGGQHVYATLLLNDSYLPGALVLAHSLRDAGTKKKLAVLVTVDSVSAAAITQLKTVYDYVLSVPRIRNSNPTNLYLMGRSDLHSAFTKINLWKQTQFSKIVYIDADVVAYRAPDELFSIPHAFSAAPDIGWPDIFNSGVMVLTPNMGDYYALMAMAERGISFDGADQGLLNMYFRNTFNRLSFTYNVTPSAHYQYLPAYRHFQSSISMAHFIGSDKPWFAGRAASIGGSSPYDEMVGRWWAIYDRHYRQQETVSSQAGSASELVQYLTKGEFNPAKPTLLPSAHGFESTPLDQQGQGQSTGENQSSSLQRSVQHFDHGHEQSGHQEEGLEDSAGVQTRDSPLPPVPFSESQRTDTGTLAETPSEEQHHSQGTRDQSEKREPVHQITMTSWDAQRQPPPADSKPEAMNFPATHYEMSSDAKPFVPPLRYPSPPKNMWYEVPKERASQPPKPLFPWEANQPPPSRSFAGEPIQTSNLSSSEPAVQTEFGAPAESHFSVTGTPPSTDAKKEVVTPTTPTIKAPASDSWGSYSHTNAWDDHPEINRYVEGLPWHRRAKSNPSAGGPTAGRKSAGAGRGRGLKLTDFPSAVERPSLPVTPAPVTREGYWADGEGDDSTSGAGGAAGSGRPPLPAAEGVPSQSEWDPQAQLQLLARQQSELLLRRLSGMNEEGETQASQELPQRSLPYGSQPERISSQLQEPALIEPVVHAPRPLKGAIATQPIRKMGDTGEFSVVSQSNVSFVGSEYGQQGEPSAAERTPMLPTEEDMDVLET